MRKLICLFFLIVGCASSSETNKKQSLIFEGQLLSSVSGQDWVEVPSLSLNYRDVEVDSLGKFKVENLQKAKKYKIEIRGWGYDIILDSIILNKSIKKTFTLDFHPQDPYKDLDANIDVSKGDLKLLITGGIAPSLNTDEDNLFEKKYSINYYDFGCVPPAPELIKKYNTEAFRYLDEKYNNKWRSEVRNDVEFINSN